VAKFHGVGPKTTARMHALGIETGADLRRQTLDFLQRNFGKAGSWYYEIARGQDDRPVHADRERKSSGSETTFSEDLTDPLQIEAGVIAMADDVWAWCEKTNARGRTVTVKIKWADFQISTRSRSMEMSNEGEATSASSRPHPIGIPTDQRHSTRWRDAFQLSGAVQQRSR
jgi:DNA polymerase IV